MTVLKLCFETVKAMQWGGQRPSMTTPFLSGHLTEQRTNEQLNSFVCETAIEGYYYIYNNKCIVSTQMETVQLFVRCSFNHYSYMTRTRSYM